jgi:hypothetical protein
MAATPLREAPNLQATPANQLVVAGNACGPTALLNAFRFASPAWQRASAAIAGSTDKELIYTIIRESGMRPSASIKGRPRWSKNGVNLVDLCDIGNELTRGHFLPLMRQEVRRSPEKAPRPRPPPFRIFSRKRPAAHHQPASLRPPQPEGQDS